MSTSFARRDDPVQQSAIAIQHLDKRFGKFHALRDVSFTIPSGTFVSVFGANGAGKTTLLRILATISPPTAGDVQIGGWNPVTHGSEARRQLGVVLHQSLLYPALSAEENLLFYARMFALPHPQERVAQVLAAVGLSERRHEVARTFSHGMQRRLAIARAILHEPALLLFDEPYAGLDVAAVQLVRQMLDEFHARGLTLIVTTHQTEIGLAQCDVALVLQAGRLAYFGSPVNVRGARPEQP